MKEKRIADFPRGAGVLLHVTSLPSPFEIGDLGPGAHLFIDALQQAGQRYWQLLPMNPIERSQQFSPYSSTSSVAGNPLLISPELLAQEGYLTKTDLMAGGKSSDKVNFKRAESEKRKILGKAFRTFLKSRIRLADFESFESKERQWLDDYARFVVLKQKHRGQPWTNWDVSFRTRKQRSMDRLAKEGSEALLRIKWEQFVFFDQWKKLKDKCEAAGIMLIGDIPFYIGHDSADVWSHPEIFALDARGNVKGIAGVPPDYFNEDGQLWGMPVFDWQALRETGYAWWIQRIRKNIEQYHIVRLDHFRAFADYWEVPAGKRTAKGGAWKKGPGEKLFNALEQALGGLPFIAEDLGDINQPVLDLRDKYQFPGMKVLQFAFGDNMPKSDYIPHNFTSNAVVYTGTHDNNTTLGWFRKDAGKTEKANLRAYLQKPVSASNINEEMTRLAYGSTARIAIIPMQDILGLDERARMNMPASTKNNWQWRLKGGAFSSDKRKWLRTMATLYNRTE